MEGSGVERTKTRIDVIGCNFVHPVTSARGVVFDQIYILLHPFHGWLWNVKKKHELHVIECKLVHPGSFSSKFTSSDVYSCVGFGMEQKHPTNRRNRM